MRLEEELYLQYLIRRLDLANSLCSISAFFILNIFLIAFASCQLKEFFCLMMKVKNVIVRYIHLSKNLKQK